ncbi:helix-turn-helix domain-containing protein [Haloprofundus salinisoli]|uniref:helix-turn-helix domain-containing protein n=1 Tax=Haloprofundus salinisoli TaxID=2876193 RepID=UPI001CCD2125|nr:helix-turn-helix domain-containing protein [Haloprofundus salinisoli]
MDSRGVDGLEAGRAALLAAERADEQRSLTARLDSRESLAEFRAYCNAHDLDFELDDIAEDTQPRAVQYDLSTPQLDALVATFEMGSFNIPRDTTLGEVADYFGISTHAASERFR